MEDETPKPEAARVLDIRQIMSILPHRYPFLLIDRVLEVNPRKRIVAIKNVTINEHFFQGHFPDYAIMPGVLMVEAIAQAGGALLLTEIPDRADKLMVFTGIDSAKFRRPVVPGDQLRIEVTVLQWRSRAVRMHGVATVDGKVACEATVMCQLVPRAKKAAPPESAAEPKAVATNLAAEKGPASSSSLTSAQTESSTKPDVPVVEPTVVPVA
jgi:3-hydroxyacyl-[acyl-carrier-protein] dehydratase